MFSYDIRQLALVAATASVLGTGCTAEELQTPPKVDVPAPLPSAEPAAFPGFVLEPPLPDWPPDEDSHGLSWCESRTDCSELARFEPDRVIRVYHSPYSRLACALLRQPNFEGDQTGTRLVMFGPDGQLGERSTVVDLSRLSSLDVSWLQDGRFMVTWSSGSDSAELLMFAPDGTFAGTGGGAGFLRHADGLAFGSVWSLIGQRVMRVDVWVSGEAERARYDLPRPCYVRWLGTSLTCGASPAN